MDSIFNVNQSDIIEEFMSTSRYFEDEFDFDIVTFPCLKIWIRFPLNRIWSLHSQRIRYAIVLSHVNDFNARNICISAKLP